MLHIVPALVISSWGEPFADVPAEIGAWTLLSSLTGLVGAQLYLDIANVFGGYGNIIPQGLTRSIVVGTKLTLDLVVLYGFRLGYGRILHPNLDAVVISAVLRSTPLRSASGGRVPLKLGNHELMHALGLLFGFGGHRRTGRSWSPAHLEEEDGRQHRKGDAAGGNAGNDEEGEGIVLIVLLRLLGGFHARSYNDGGGGNGSRFLGRLGTRLGAWITARFLGRLGAWITARLGAWITARFLGRVGRRCRGRLKRCWAVRWLLGNGRRVSGR